MQTTGLVALAALAITAAGCSYMDFNLASRSPEWGQPGAANENGRARLRARRLAQALSAWEREGVPGPGDYRIGRADVLELSIFALETPDETGVLQRTVSEDGNVTLPLLGVFHVAGLTASECEQRIRGAYEGRYLRNAQVTVSVAQYRSAPVVVTGTVNKPGVFYLESGSSTVLEMLARAGGLSRDAGDELLIVRGTPDAPADRQAGNDGPVPAEPSARGAEGVALDLTELIDRGNLLLNLPIRAGDIITVPPCAPQFVYLLGYVRRPGAYELTEGARVDALRAVALGGGLTSTARAQKSFLIRETPEGQNTIPVDLARLARSELPPLYLEPGDTLVVGTTTTGRLREFLAPNMGASISASASVAP